VLDSLKLDGRLWQKVQLPVRPNGAAGWIPAERARVTSTPWRVQVSLRRRTVSVLRGGRVVRRFGAVIGAPGTPTPTGRFAVSEPIPQANAGGFIGPWALHLTAFSDVLDDFGGGPGRIAIHGRGGASLRDPLGTARSHGCVRVDNAQVRFLARVAVPGTPVRISR
jgi:lipoprotein-anchoring transpeptidase ErfK/SrfK